MSERVFVRLILTRVVLSSVAGRQYNASSVTKLGGDFVEGGNTDDQLMHSDWTECKPLDPNSAADAVCDLPVHSHSPPCVCISIAVHDIGLAHGPLRIMTWDSMMDSMGKYGPEPPTLEQECELLALADESIIRCTVPQGTAIIRDVRIWHGGTCNSLGRTRFLPGYLTCSHDYMHSRAMYRPPRLVPRDLYNMYSLRYPNHGHKIDYISCW